ncbi:hypothetical protein NA57DRAFT_79915 [Rhizodiscina lignyota]|uniref:Rpr2-domain-containing protein n=1 Tax=Rhizodiscina lignyota TaxID=1504668 RepID=A0A9P4I7U6_9PEZI|nr:hypothetical protein NA57DRAFT_79915 [Rhizodiscina lignyota]
MPSKVEAKLNETRLSFLRASADHLAFTAPTTSAFFNSQASRIVSRTGETTKAKRERVVDLRPVCDSCGNFLISGLSSTSSIERSRAHERKQRNSTNTNTASRPTKSRVKHQVIQCQRCNSTTRLLIQSPISKNLGATSKTDSSTAKLPPSTVTGQETKGVTTNSGNISNNAQATDVESQPMKQKNSAKARAKARKQGGLQAQLEKSKKTTSGSSGRELDLMDFMSGG